MLLEVKNVTKWYGSRKKIALENVSFSLDKGKIVGLIGENGAGKTTLLKLIAGFVQPSTGEILIEGKKVGLLTRRFVAFLPDTIMFEKWMRVSDAIEFFKDFYDDFDNSKAFKLLEKLKVNPKGKIHQLSRGNIEKFSIAMLFSRDTKLYLLDEPLAYVDPVSRDFVFEMILQNISEEKSIIISTNIISEIEHIFDEVIFLNNGKILYYGSTERIREEKGLSINQFFKEVLKDENI
ncbi:ATP-binding cassette domain-containing protein [Caldicellulosiruptor naganoensis]|uniref:ABC transporter ATP-binding protein n=1 Tax=Caldicellulosiruptor naganoensis TaxID=29324 RepID=A0ABY7BFS8_9FIRM|nr:ABC transporter ATP-binding protein [Caldicellulosiruptor naganoensis]WAM31669.1 ABC transporter ATP-binding protein [Caldicellulosiruptor naganoensis]